MRQVASVLLLALVATAWVTCAAAAPGDAMVCCVKVQHGCPKMAQVKMCCPEPQPANPDAVATAAVPLASVHVQSDAVFLLRTTVSPIFTVAFHPLLAETRITPPSRHSLDCILLI